QLSSRAVQLASAFRERLGTVSGGRVVLYLENCSEFFEILLGCWSAGLCAVPVNARLHPKEVGWIVGKTRAKLVFATPGLAGAVPEGPGLEIISTSSASDQELLAADPMPRLPAGGDDPAWVFLISGPT